MFFFPNSDKNTRNKNHFYPTRKCKWLNRPSGVSGMTASGPCCLGVPREKNIWFRCLRPLPTAQHQRQGYQTRVLGQAALRPAKKLFHSDQVAKLVSCSTPLTSIFCSAEKDIFFRFPTTVANLAGPLKLSITSLF